MMEISKIIDRIKTFLRKSKDEDLDVLGRNASGKVPNPTSASSGDHGMRGGGEIEDEDLAVIQHREVLDSQSEENQPNGKLAAAIRKRKAIADDDEIVDEELPSVNRRAKSNQLPRVMMALAAAVSIYVIFSMLSGSKGKTSPPPQPLAAAAAQPPQVANTLPPLVMPELQPDPPPSLQPQVVAPAIPLNKTAQAVVPPEDPDWVLRKVNSAVLLDPKKDPGKAESAASDAHADKGTADKASDLKTKVGDTKNSSASTLTDAGDNLVVPRGELSENIKPLVVTKGVSAGILANRNYVVAKGTLLDCALETAINSSLAGLVTCRLTRDVYSDNGRVIMLDRGSQLVGEYKSGIAEGMVRIFVLWTRAKTPKGVVIDLNSPGTDALGRTGLEGFVDTHFMERFGAAIMLSAVQMGFDYAKAEAQSKSTASTTTISTAPQMPTANTSILNTIANEQLKKSVNIPPVLYINQGENVQVMVVRDLDFSSVYGLEDKK